MQYACVGVEDVSAESAAIEGLYREEGPRLWRALLGYTGDAETAADTVMEAFAQLLRRGDAVRDPRRWVWRAAFRIAAGEMQRRRRTSIQATTEQTYETDEPAYDLVVALRSLSPRQRAAVVLHHAADYPIREVAAILGSTPAAVKVHLMRGRRRLRELLEEDTDA